ncbi:hypothetical protein KIN20_008833 [Parelaphostrongylus tenuis]|uniref:DH domain-containing protein n=1 Tax=Parelaphostrongylus tenuis TaxID=148309 RepID=A0AAD5M5D1_PARTN|nr:hypothetical protein KIN20_008833 [Parelaphostrongylus tenuis]
MRDSLLARVAEKRPLLKKREIVTAFGKIQPILNIHERICERLEGVIEQWDGDASSASEIWTEAFDDLLRVYPSYCNHCDLAVETIKAACAHSAKLRMFIEDHERSKEFKRQRTVDIMVTPVQRLPSVKLLLESLKKKTRVQREKDQIGEAIEAIDKVLSKSNTVRQITEASVSQLNLINEIQDLPNDGSLVFERKMKFSDVLHECKGAVKEELKRGHHQPLPIVERLDIVQRERNIDEYYATFLSKNDRMRFLSSKEPTKKSKMVFYRLEPNLNSFFYKLAIDYEMSSNDA